MENEFQAYWQTVDFYCACCYDDAFDYACRYGYFECG